MSDVVLDSSVVVKWFIGETDSDKAEKLFRDAVSRGERLIVLDLVLAEVANALWKQRRRKMIDADEVIDSLEDLLQMPLEIKDSARLLPRAMQIAMQYDRAVYDSLFVALTESQGLTGITADDPLFNVTHTDFPQLLLLRNL